MPCGNARRAGWQLEESRKTTGFRVVSSSCGVAALLLPSVCGANDDTAANNGLSNICWCVTIKCAATAGSWYKCTKFALHCAHLKELVHAAPEI